MSLHALTLDASPTARASKAVVLAVRSRKGWLGRPLTVQTAVYSSAHA